jgi:hypothetical protein
MRGLIETVETWFGHARAAPVERRVAELLAGHVECDPFPQRVAGGAFELGLTYFGVRLSGLHMVDARRFATNLLPLCVCLAEFDYGGERRSVPFSIGPKTIQQRLAQAGITDAKDAKPAWIELRDLTVLKPTPVNSGNLSLYTGLFSVPGNDLIKTLLDVVGTVGSAIGSAPIGPGLKVAEQVYDSFGTLLGLKDVQQVAAALIGNTLTDRGSGYLLIANSREQEPNLPQMRVVGGRLCWPRDGAKAGAPVIEFDHALLALERYDTIVEKTGLAPVLFEQPWATTRSAIGRGNKAEASAAYDKLMSDIYASLDLTEQDRVALIGGYQKIYEDLANRRWPKRPEAQNRGDGGTGLVSRIQSAAARADMAGGRELSSGLSLVADALKRPAEGIPDPQNSADATKEDADAVIGVAQMIRQHIAELGTQDAAQARSIATALVRATIGYELPETK